MKTIKKDSDNVLIIGTFNNYYNSTGNTHLLLFNNDVSNTVQSLSLNDTSSYKIRYHEYNFNEPSTIELDLGQGQLTIYQLKIDGIIDADDYDLDDYNMISSEIEYNVYKKEITFDNIVDDINKIDIPTFTGGSSQYKIFKYE